MPLLNYTTTVPAMRTISEITTKLVKAGATQVLTEHRDGMTSGLSFAIEGPHGLLRYRLPIDITAVLKVLMADRAVSGRYREPAHAERVAWRILKDWIEAQLAIIATRMVTLDQIMLPYQLVGEGQTVYDLYLSRQLELGAGDA